MAYSECQAQLDIGFILDLSGSVYSVYSLGVEFIRKIVQGLEFRFDRSRAAFVIFSDQATVRFYLNTYQDKMDILEALSLGDTGGRTNTQEALKLTLDEIFQANNGDRSEIPNVLILLTDGGSNIEENLTLRRAEDLKIRGTQIYVVAAGSRVNMKEVNAVASEATDVFVHRVQNSEDVLRQSSLLLNSIC